MTRKPLTLAEIYLERIKKHLLTPTITSAEKVDKILAEFSYYKKEKRQTKKKED